MCNVKHTQEQNYEGLKIAFERASKLTSLNRLISKEHTVCGDKFFNENDYIEATGQYNAARSLDRNNESIYEKCLKALLVFYEKDVEKFITDDLINLLSAVR